jgi:protein involved in polysaccharide export with SLBB domain
MKKVFPVVRFALPAIMLLCPIFEAPAVTQDPKSPQTPTAFKSPDPDRKNQSAASESGKQTNNPEGSSPNVDLPRAGSGDSASQRLYESATNLYAAGKFDEAISAFLQSARLRPDSPQTHYGLGMAYARSKSYREASDSFKQAVKFKPDWPEANFRVGMMAYVLGNKGQANDVYNKLRKLNSPLANTLYRVIREDGSGAGVPESANSDSQTTPANVAPASASNTEPVTTLMAPASASKTESVTTQTGMVITRDEKSAAPANSPAKDPSAAAPSKSEPSSGQPLTAVYRVGVGDILDIRLLNSTIPRSTLFTVMDGGLIDFPVAGGPIQVAGFTTEDIQSRVAAELKRRAVEINSLVSVSVRQFSSHAVIVTGLVASPGTRFLRREAIPLYVLLAEVQPRLDAGRITILRAGVEARTLDLSDSNALSTLIQQGDVLNVGPRPQEFYYIGGRVNYPGQKSFQSGITLLQALLAAGGPSQNENNIDLSRESADGRLTTTRFTLKEIKSGKLLDPKLRPGDRIEVVR